MKRIVIVCCLLAGMLLLSVLSMYRVDQVKNQMDAYVEAIALSSREGDAEALGRQLEDLSAFWKREEKRLIHYVRHSHVDEITRAIAKLPSLAAFENYAELSAELYSIQWQMESIWYSELPIWGNIL